MNQFIRFNGIEAYNEVIAWNKKPDDVLVYESLEDIEEDYGIQIDDVEDVFQYFGSSVRVIVATGNFLITRSFN